ncbi:hypothetical protein GGF49_000112 [Coemansia sp. RSA 1853]|nr:hypothetical protein GGF49_000112 [Coemansia sp. RSA 1853]
MFAGQRQRRGMNKVDEFMSKLQSPTYHLECTTLHDSLETSTPFSITSNMTWDTMRFVFESTHAEAKEELAFTEACVQQDQSTESKLANPKSDYQSRALLRVTQSIYAHIFLSGPKNLTQLTSEMLSESLVKSKKTIKVPRRTFRRVSSKRSKLIPGGLLRMDSTGKSNSGVKSDKQIFASEPGTPAVKETEAFRVWQRIASPFRRKHHTGALPTPPEHPGADVGMEEADCFSGIHNQRSTQSAQPLKQANRAPSITQDDACSQRKRQVTSSRMPTLTWDDAEDVDAHSDSMISVHEHDDGNSMLPIGPARLEATFVEPKALPKYTHQHPKSSTRVPNLSLQLSDVAAFNRTAAVHLLGDIKKRIWQLEAVWTNFHISDFVYAQDDMIGDLQRMWLVWVSLLGSPTEANTIKSKIILRGLVKSWDVYRAVLDCSRYTPDNDDVLLNTTLWVAEMAAKYGTTDNRGRVAQTAIFRMGCRCSDHINSRVVFLRSRFLQSALITLSPLSKGQPVNIDQVHMFLVECKLFLSLGISGSRMLLLSLERGLRRIFIGCSTYSGSLPEPALQSAAVMLVSMATMLSSGRVLATHSANKRIRELTDSNIVNLAEDSKLAEDSQVANTDAQSIRNFLVENVIYRCANPEARVSDQAHKYNQELGSTASEHGLVLYLQSVGYSQHVSMSLGDFVFSSEDEQRFIGSPAESIKQIGEVLYVTLMARFDENNRLGNYGAIKHPLKMDLFRSQVQHNMGFDTTRTNGNYFMPLSKSDALLREINSLDRMRAQETIKIAVLYVGPGQWTEAEILSNTQQDTSQAYRKLERDGSDGKTCPYFFDEGIEVVFHDATLMPTDKNDIRQLKKKRHIGNDHVHIIWNESHHNYRPETISGDFGNVQIQIRPLEPGEYGVGLYCDDQVKPFGPLLNGMVVSADVLPTAVRTTAIVGHRRAAQVFFKTFMHPYAMRQETINRISERHIDESCKSYMKVNQDALSRNEERVVVAKDVSSKVDELREQFGDLNTILAEASAEMEDMAAVPVIAVYFPQLGFLSSIDISYFSSESTIAPQLNDWELEFQTDQQRYYKNILTDALDRSPGDVFTLVNDAEAEVCLELQGKICAYIPEITRAAELAAQIDCLQSLATAAIAYGYCRPQFNDDGCYHIQQGRHPIMESSVEKRQFIPNDIHLAGNECMHRGQQLDSLQRTLVLLGPNGSGKSVLIKQVALIVYLAHVGSFVPATSANIGLTERIMVMGRASESLVRQQSALSTDLQAVAGILKHSGYKTMVLLDEFGRGTSPADGIGLLCGVLTSLVLRSGLRPACLAVTHFQEITQVQAIRHIWHQIQVRTMAIRENANGLVYLFKSSDNAAPSSAYAIMCARGAGIPDQILDRAQELVGDYTEDDR